MIEGAADPIWLGKGGAENLSLRYEFELPLNLGALER